MLRVFQTKRYHETPLKILNVSASGILSFRPAFSTDFRDVFLREIAV